jgi:hypothetical protein
MLKVPATFPDNGSYALLFEGSDAHLVRIHQRVAGSPDEVLASFPLRPGSAGTRRMALADLVDPTPLTSDEDREIGALYRKDRKSRADRARFTALAERRSAAQIIEPLIAQAKRLMSLAA